MTHKNSNVVKVGNEYQLKDKAELHLIVDDLKAKKRAQKIWDSMSPAQKKAQMNEWVHVGEE